MKRLIVNADDFGLTTGVNRAIVEAHERGIVSSATLMANGPTFNDAVTMAKSVPKLAIGCHIDLIQLAPVSEAGRVKTLTDGERFRPGFARFAANAMRGKIHGEEVAREAAQQIGKLQSAGISVSHFDTHKHTHVFPPVLKALLRAARDTGVKAVRNPFEPESMVTFKRAVQRWGVLSRWMAVQSLRTLASDFRREVGKAGLTTTDGTVGIALTGHLDQQALCEVLKQIPHGTWELVTHPGYVEPELARLSKLTGSREDELRLLTSAETCRTIEAAGIEIISYAALAP